MLCVDEWEISPSRVMGAGNKTLEMAISEQLLQMRPLFDPDPQREILRDVVLNITDDPARAERLVPIEPLKVSDSVHDAQLASGTLMQGLPVALKTGQNHVEYIQAMLGALQTVIAKCQKSGGMATPDQIQGMQNIAQNIGQHIKVLSQDKNEKAAVAAFEKQLSKLMNFVKAFMQRLQEQMKKQSQQQGQQGDPKDAAKVQAMLMAAKVKADSAQKSHGQKTAQRELSWEKEEARKQKQFEMEQQRENLAAVAEVHRGSLKSVGDE
jgi:ribosomal protein S15P/S13E